MGKNVKIYFEDGERTWGDFDISGKEPIITVGGAPYDLKSFAATGATVAVNDQETLKRLQAAGIKARPTAKQTKISISCSDQLRDRLTEAGAKHGRTVTSILVEAAEEWLEKNK